MLFITVTHFPSDEVEPTPNAYGSCSMIVPDSPSMDEKGKSFFNGSEIDMNYCTAYDITS